MRSNLRKFQIRSILVLGALIFSYGCYWFLVERFETWNSKIVDRLFVLRSSLKPVDNINDKIIAHVDANFYLNRSHHAQVIRNLSAMNVAAQLIDHIFAGRVGKEDDLPLIDAASEAGRIYFGMAFESLTKQYTGIYDTLSLEDVHYLDQTKWQLSTQHTTDTFYVGLNPSITYAVLSSASRGLGFLNTTVDRDGILRRLPLLVRYRGALYPSLSFRAVCDYLKVLPQDIIVQPGKSIILKDVKLKKASLADDIVIPIDKHGRLIINYPDTREGSKHYSYSEILQASEDSAKLNKLKKELSAKIVILSEAVGEGFTIRSSKAGMTLSSGQIHAVVLQNILTQSFLKELSGFGMFCIEAALLIAMLLLSARFSSISLSFGSVVLAGIFCLVGVSFFIYFNIIFQFIRPLFMAAITLSFLLIYIGIEKALLHAETERARRIAERELEIGRQIQTGFFPTTLPVPDGWELITHFQAARHVAGDFYDVFTLVEDRKIGIVVADVCEKGVGAALFMALFRSLIRVLSGQAGSDDRLDIKRTAKDPKNTLEDTIKSINNYISITHEDAGMFATMFYGILDSCSGELYYINGGHEPPAVVNNEGIKNWLAPTGPAVGLYPYLDFEVHHITIEPGETLVLFTDGVIDARSKSGENFSKNRLTNILDGRYSSAEDLVNAILDQINAHIVEQGQFDDITIVALRRKEPSD